MSSLANFSPISYKPVNFDSTPVAISHKNNCIDYSKTSEFILPASNGSNFSTLIKKDTPKFVSTYDSKN